MANASTRQYFGPQQPAGFSAEAYLQQRFTREGRRMALTAKTPAELAAWRRKTVAHLKKITGYDTMRPVPLKPRVTDGVRCEGYTRQRVEIQTEPGVVMPFFVLIPDGPSEPRGAVICAHGHVSAGKLSPAGVMDVAAVAETVNAHRYDYGVQFARAGLIAFCPDARGFGERQERLVRKGDNLMASSCQHLNNMAFPLGQTVTGMWTWDLHRLVDYIQTRDDCDPKRIACVGLSGGGLQTLWATALDAENRIRAAVVSGYFYGYRESLLEDHGNCSCNYVPGLYQAVDMGDLAAMIAPRPLLIETGDQDPLNGKSGMKNVNSQVAIARKAYRLLGKPRNLVHDVFSGGHRWNGEKAIPFIVCALQEV